jgi:hypothetical protein
VFGEFRPKLSEESRAAELLFLGNIQPDLQREVRQQCSGARLAGLDSMNLWIETARDSLLAAVAEVDLLFLNDAEIRELMEEPNLVRAARAVMELGPRAVVAKQGEYGAAMFVGDRFFSLPAYPLETVRDPTGAGDSFAGGFMGYLASRGEDAASDDAELRRAMTYGSVLASFNVEEFGTDRVRRLDRAEIDARYDELRGMTELSVAPTARPRRSRWLAGSVHARELRGAAAELQRLRHHAGRRCVARAGVAGVAAVESLQPGLQLVERPRQRIRVVAVGAEALVLRHRRLGRERHDGAQVVDGRAAGELRLGGLEHRRHA